MKVGPIYHVVNFQHQDVEVFETLDAAKTHIVGLQKIYKELFYVIELPVVYVGEPQ